MTAENAPDTVTQSSASSGRDDLAVVARPRQIITIAPRQSVAVRRGARMWGALVAVFAAVGLGASAVLAVERIHMLTTPDYRPTCSINPVLSCGSVMTTPQASVLGFPNPFLGIGAFTVLLTTGVLAAAGVVLPRWVWLAQTAATLGGFVFVNWLVFQSLYRIHALCPYCMAVWVVTPVLAALSLTAATRHTRQDIWSWVWVVVPVWLVAVAVAGGVEFWDYWVTLI